MRESCVIPGREREIIAQQMKFDQHFGKLLIDRMLYYKRSRYASSKYTSCIMLMIFTRAQWSNVMVIAFNITNSFLNGKFFKY